LYYTLTAYCIQFPGSWINCVETVKINDKKNMGFIFIKHLRSASEI